MDEIWFFISIIIEMIDAIAIIAVLLGTIVIGLSATYWIYAVRRIHVLEAKLWLRQVRREAER